MTLKQIRILLGNAEYEIAGAAAKDAIRTMVNQIEENVLAGEEVKLTMYTHKKNGIVYLLCDAVAVEGTKFVCVALYGSEPKVYAASSLKRMFKKEIETLEVEKEELPEVPSADKAAQDDTADTVPAAVDTDDTAAGNKCSRGDYKFLEHKTNKLAAEIVKYFLKLGYSYQFVSDYVKIHKNEHSISKLYYSKKGNVRMAINPVCEQAFKSCFPVNYYSFVKAWTLGLKVFISADDDLKKVHKFLSIVDKLHSEKYGRGC